MNYLELINQFWLKDMEYHFSDKETALYFYLLNISNSIHWKNPFGLSNAMTIAKFGWGKTSFDHTKNRLKAAGLIDFKPGDGRGNVYRYIIKGIEKGHYPNTLYDHLSAIQDEKVFEKGTQMIPLFDTLSGVSEKGTQKSTLSDTLSMHLSDTLSNLKPATSINNKHKHKVKDSISFFNKNDIEVDVEIETMDIAVDVKKEKESEKEKSSAQNEVLDLFHYTCRSFPQVTKLTDKRKERISRRLVEMGNINILEKVFETMEASDFLKGNNKTGWKATFDWVFENSDNWIKILEGNYDNKTVNDTRFMGLLQTDLKKF